MLSLEMHDLILKRVKSIPITGPLQLLVTRMEEGFCELTAPHMEQFDGVCHSFHGGILMTVADSAACVAVMTRTGPEARIATSDMNIRFLAPCRGGVIAHARVLKSGRTMSLATVDLFDKRGRQVAVAQVNYAVLKKSLGSSLPSAACKPEAVPA